MGREDKATRKSNYFLKINKLFEDYPKCFIVGVDNVGSKQMQAIRIALRNDAVVLNGKNTMIRKAIKGMLEKNNELEKVLPYVKGNIGFVFTDQDLITIRDKILDNKVAAPAKAGALAPVDVKVPAQNTGLGPEKTSFFQALQIPTKIQKGTIEIISEVHLIKAGDKVGASEATLLNMLKISPFTYGLTIEQVYDSGTTFDPDILDITNEKMRESVTEVVTNLAALSLSIGYPCVASAPHLLVNGFKNLVALCAATDDLTFSQAETMLEYIRDPSKMAAAVSAAPAATGGKADAGKAAEEAKDEEPEEESDDDMGFGLFD